MRSHGEVMVLNEDCFETTIANESIVFVDFWAQWCAPCMQFADVYARVARDYPSILFATVNVGEFPLLAEMFEIRSIPHLMVFKEGIAIYSESGSIPESVLKELADQALSADVSEIKAQLDSADT